MSNQDVSRLFSEIADLLEIKGEDAFRVNSYRRVARAIDDLTEDLADVAERNGLQKIPGVGKGSAERITEYLKSGKIELHDELATALPPGILKLLQIPGLGPKKVKLLHSELGVGGVEDLKAAIAAGKVEHLAGFGKKSVEKIVEGIEFLARSAGRTPLGIALPIAESLRDAVAGFKIVNRVEIAGSVRRGKETIGDVDLLCEADDGPGVIEAFTKLPQVAGVRAAGDTKASVLVPDLEGSELQIDLRVVPERSFGAALQYFTGSKEHNVRLREIAVKKGWKLNEYGLFDGDTPLAGEREEEIYRRLGFEPIPPELREDRGEIESRGKLPELIAVEHIRGDLHLHTTASDGHASIEEMALAARERGYEYIAVTDHSRSSVIANGLSIERLERHIETIRAADEKVRGITILAGIECDVLSDGALDYPDDLLAKLDWVIASLHAAQGQPRDRVTKRTIEAMENPHIHCIGHPSGRLIGRRDAMDLDWEKVFAAAARTGTALEISATWQRLDLKDVHVRQAMDAGCWLSINTDAHSPEEYDQIALGVKTARRGWATKDRVVNALPVSQLKEWLKAKKM